MDNAEVHPKKTQITKFCKHCGVKIPVDAIICTACGRQVETLKGEQPQPNIIIHNTNTNVHTNIVGRTAIRQKNKWVALLLCIFLGYVGGHKFYEGKFGLGVLYIFTGGLLGIGAIIDFIIILTKPNPYYI